MKRVFCCFQIVLSSNSLDTKSRKCDFKDCLDILHGLNNPLSGVKSVRSQINGTVSSVYCDMTTDGGGWTVFQKRFDGSLDFYKTFKEYEDGFGDLHAEFWMGLKQLYEMTAHQTTELRIDMTAANSTTSYETYQNFSLSPGPDFTLHLGKAGGTAGDDGVTGLLYNNHDNRFVTKDMDVNPNCAVKLHGGWWYRGSTCSYVNLNGHYVTPGQQSQHNSGFGGVIYYGFQQTNSLKTTQMMFRRK